MEFVATMTGQSLPNILKLFASKKINGALEIKEKDFEASIWMNEGQVIYAFSNQTMTISDALKSLNMLDNEKVTLLSSADDYTADKILVEKGLVQDKIITYIRSHQISQTLYSIVELEKANYELKIDLALPVGKPELLPASYNWLVEIYQNMYSWVQLRSKIPRSVIKPKQKTRKTQELSKEEEKVLGLCDGRKDLKDVILWSSTTFFKAFSILGSLVTKSLIEFEENGAALNSKILQEITKVLDNMEQMPGIKTAFLVDKEGQTIAKDSRRTKSEDMVNTERMASIFSHTVSNFEDNLKGDEGDEAGSTELIEQLLVERNNGDKTLLFVTGKVILVTEAFKDCDWGLLRLSAKRSMNSIKQLISMPG